MAGELHTDLEPDTDSEYLVAAGDEAASPAAAQRPWARAAGAIGLLVASAVAGTVLATSAALGTMGAGRRGRPPSYTAFRPEGVQEKAEKGVLHPDIHCHTASWHDAGTPWEKCYAEVRRAMGERIKEDPRQFVSPYYLDANSPFELFQYYGHERGFTNWACPQPCPTGTLRIYYKDHQQDGGFVHGPAHPGFDLKFGECQWDGHRGANMLMGNFDFGRVVVNKDYYAYVHHFDNYFCEGTPDRKWLVYTNGQPARLCCARTGDMCTALCSAVAQ